MVSFAYRRQPTAYGRPADDKENAMKGISVRYSPVNQAWFVLWFDQVLAIRTRKADADEFAGWLRAGQTDVLVG
jgi:hypothetical protein